MSDIKKYGQGARVVAQQSLRIGQPGQTRVVPPFTRIDVSKDITEEDLEDLLERGLVSIEGSHTLQHTQVTSAPKHSDDSQKIQKIQKNPNTQSIDKTQKSEKSQSNRSSDTASVSAERIDVLIDAMADVSEDDMGKDGKPSVKALEALLGESISASERDLAWEKYQTLLAS